MRTLAADEIPLSRNGLPTDSDWLFPEYDFDSMTVGRFADVIIERVLDRGSTAQVRWLLRQYGKRTVAVWVRRHGYRRLPRRIFDYWRWVFGIERYRRPPWERAR